MSESQSRFRGVDSAQELLPLKNGNRDLLQEIEDLKQKVEALTMAKAGPKLGNPAVVGLAGFGCTTLVLQFHNIGWLTGVGPVVWLGFIFGGLAQMIAGLQEFYSGNNFGYSAFTTYGCFWISLALLLVGNENNLFKSSAESIGYFLIAFTIYTGIMTVGTACINLALFVTFVLLFLGFVLLDIEHFNHAPAVKVAAGWVLLFCALGAWYVMAHLIYLDTWKIDLLPVGPAPRELVRRFRQRNTNAYRSQLSAASNNESGVNIRA